MNLESCVHIHFSKKLLRFYDGANKSTVCMLGLRKFSVFFFLDKLPTSFLWKPLFFCQVQLQPLNKFTHGPRNTALEFIVFPSLKTYTKTKVYCFPESKKWYKVYWCPVYCPALNSVATLHCELATFAALVSKVERRWEMPALLRGCPHITSTTALLVKAH